MPLAQLPSSTIKLIGSSQVITSVSSVIKELMENSIDSGATIIEIRLDKHGLEKIEVKDDGCGIGKSDATIMCLPSFTSKISDFSDLDNLSSYGFRGEALSALCNVSQVNVTTKTADDEIATCYTYDNAGQVICSKISHITKGTIVTITDLFKNLPVRKQFVSSSKRAAEELKKVEKIVKSLAIVHPRLKVTLIHNKFLIWQKSSVANLRQSVMQVISLNIVKQLHHILHNTQQIRIEMLVPKRDCDVPSLCYSNFADAYFLFINSRPVRNKEIEKTVYNKLFEYFGVYVPVNKSPVCVTCLNIPSHCLDVNLEPNKTRVYFKDQDDVLDIVKQCLHLYYGDQKKEAEEDTKPKRRKVEEGKCQESDSKTVNLSNECKPRSCGESEESGKSESPYTLLAESESLSESQEPAECPVAADHLMNGCNGGYSQQDADDLFEKFCLEKDIQLQETASSKTEDLIMECVDIEEHDVTGNNVRDEYSDYFETNQNIAVEGLDNHSLILGNSISKNNKIKKSTEPRSKHEEGNNSILKFLAKDGVTPSRLNNIEKYNDNSSISVKDNDLFVNSHVVQKSDDEDDDVLITNEKSSPKVQDSFEMSLPTLSQWSRGDVSTSSGALIMGPRVLTTSSEPTSPLISQDPSNRSVSSQMGCKEMSAFTKFARYMRKQILEEEPAMSFTRVAQLLQTKWRQLDGEERKKYDEVTAVNKVSNPTKVSQTQTTLPVFKSPLAKKAPDIELEINMASLKQMVKYTKVKDVRVHLVGQLEASPLWVFYSPQSGVSAVSVQRLQEAVKFHQKLSSLALPDKSLCDDIIFSISDLGAEEWDLLLSLERSPNGVITDPRLINNGFVVEITGGEQEAHMTYVPQNISHCGLEELQEILRLLHRHGTQASLEKCRPLKIVSFIRSEVMRECNQEEPPFLHEQVSQMLMTWLQNIAPASLSCTHHLPVTLALDKH